MSKLSELADELCPEGVEYRLLGELVKIRNGQDWKTQEPGSIPVYGSGGRIAHGVARALSEGPSVLLPRKGSLEVRYVDEPVWNVDTVFTTECNAEQLETRFFYYVMKSMDLTRISTSVTRPSITQSALRKLLIPVPPLALQQEIVRVLDAFTALEQSLVSELALRKKQFEEYLSEVLQTSNSGWKSATLGDIGSVRMCKRIMKHQTSLVGDVPFFKIGSFGGRPDAYIPRELFEEYRSKYSFPRVGEILISAAGTIGRTVKYDGEAAYFQDSNIVWLENDETEVTNDYLYYWYKVINWTTDSGTIKRLYNKNLLAAGISYPNKAGQEEIVAKLDSFDSLIQSIKQEITLRRKQYEFYRDELLSFTPKKD